MYKVYLDSTELLHGVAEGVLLVSPKATLEINNAGSFEFTMLPNHPLYDSIEKMKSKISVYQNDENIFAGRVTEIEEDFYKRRKVYCEGELAYFNDSIQRPAEYHDMTVRGYLQALIDVHNAQVEESKQFQLGVVTVTDSNDSLYRYTNWEKTLSVIKTDLVDTLGGYIFIRRVNGIRYIDYLADFPNTSTQVIEFGKNLLDFTRNFDATDIATAVIPLGAKLEESEIEALGERVTIKSVNDDCDFVYSQSAVDTYGWIFRTVTYDNVNVASTLKKKGEAFLREVQFENMTIEAKAIDLRFLNGTAEQFKLGDKIRVLSVPHGLDKFFPLTKMTVYLDKISSNTVTLGTAARLSMTASNASNNAEIQKKIDSAPSKSDILKEAIANATALINQKTNGFVTVTGDELLIMDTDSTETATKVWRWNLNGLGYSSNGYAGPFETAITMDGQIVGSRLVGGSVSAEKLDITYRTDVERKINEAEDAANEYTDGALVDYYTSAETETAIKNSADSILLSAKSVATTTVRNELENYSTTEEINNAIKVSTDSVLLSANQTSQKYVDGKLEDYVTTSELKTTADGINLKVSKKVGSDEIISAINQSAESVTINAGKINLNGAVTANNYFKIGLDGKVTTTAGDFTGDISATTIRAKKTYYITDTDFGNKMAVIASRGDGTSDTEYRFGRLSATVYNSASNSISFVDSSQDRYIHFYTDTSEFHSIVQLDNLVIDSKGTQVINPYSDGTIYFGPSSTNVAAYGSPSTVLRGKNVRLYAVQGGGVYLGSSGSTAITSDENLKNIYEIDDRYEKFFKALKPISYIYKNTGHRKHIGYGARAVEKALIDSGLTTEEFAGLLIDEDIIIGKDEMQTEEDVHFESLYSLRLEEFVGLNTYMIQKLMNRVAILERSA